MKGFYAIQSPTFEEFQQRGVYLAQVATAQLANSMARNFNNALASSDIMAAIRKAPFNLRTVRAHRDKHAQAFRDAVAAEMRAIRAQRRSH